MQALRITSSLNIQIMKKIVLFALLFMGITSVYAQGDIRLGFQASPVISWMTTNNNSIVGSGSNVGFKMGLIAENYFQENYAITSGLGLVFNQGGTLNHELGGNFFPTAELSDTTYNNLPNNVDVGYNLQMLEIPIGIKLRTNEIGFFRYFGEIPFLLHLRTQARGKFLDTSKENITKDTGLLNISWGVGGGVEYGITDSTSAIAGIYFHNGLLDMTANKRTQLTDTGEEEDSKAIINSLTIRLGVLF